GIERRKLHPEDRRLQLVEARIHAGEIADIALAPAIFAQRLETPGKTVVAGHHHAAIAERTEILGGIEAERGEIAEAARTPPGEARAMALCAILDDTGAVAARQIEKGGEIGGLAVEMHGDDRGDAPG